MMRLPRLVLMILAAALCFAPLARTQAAPAGDSAAPSAELRTAVDDFWHFAKIAKYEMATAKGEEVLKESDPVVILKAFESVAVERKQRFDEQLLDWQNVPQLQAISQKLLEAARKGQLTRREDSAFIDSSIKRLVAGDRGYMLAVGQLRESGEVAVPAMLAYLRDPEKKAYHANIQKAMKDMGPSVLSPLITATGMKDYPTLAIIIDRLGELGYDVAAPAVAEVYLAKDTPQNVKDIAARVLAKFRVGDLDKLNLARMYVDLGEKFYYDSASIVAANPASMWYWDEQRGLVRKVVPISVFNELMAMRQAEQALKADAARGDAVALWLAANYKREIELPEGAADPTRAENQPNAHIYGVSAGTKYLSDVLSRALNDKNTALALRAIKSLQEIAGTSNVLAQANSPLIAAMEYPERAVRFEAAFAVASALPQQDFAGQERVVPALAEALAQTGKGGVLVLASSQERLNNLVESARKAGYSAGGGLTPDAAVQSIRTLPAVDVIIMPEDTAVSAMDAMAALAKSNPRLARAARLILIAKEPSPYKVLESRNPMITAAKVEDIDSAGLATAVEEARKRGGAMQLDEKDATAYALRSAGLMLNLAINRNPALDLASARPTLLASLEDERPEIAKAAGGVLAHVNAVEAQGGLANRALDEKTPEDVRIALFKNVATSAKLYGNLLEPTQTAGLLKTAESATQMEIRAAAAEAHGALNLPAEQVKTMIINQSKV